uniref:Uncharacterized protein n=1 Tax=viral metagenome TaxID=1070528 RepID=A0A6C0BLS9_9ZZZZ
MKIQSKQKFSEIAQRCCQLFSEFLFLKFL